MPSALLPRCFPDAFCLCPVPGFVSLRRMIGIIMGSLSDWEVMKFAAEKLDQLQIPYEKRVISAHRAPELLAEWAKTAEQRGLKVIITGAGGSAHLAGVTAALTHLPVLGVPVMGWSLNGLDSLLSIVNMPGGIPVMTVSIGKPGAINAALAAASILALNDPALRERLLAFREAQTKAVVDAKLPD